MEILTVGELLHWSYANLAMAHSAITAKAEKYGRTQFMIRSRLYAGLNKQTMSIGPLADDERLKMVLPQACAIAGVAITCLLTISFQQREVEKTPETTSSGPAVLAIVQSAPMTHSNGWWRKTNFLLSCFFVAI